MAEPILTGLVEVDNFGNHCYTTILYTSEAEKFSWFNFNLAGICVVFVIYLLGTLQVNCSHIQTTAFIG